MNTYAKAFLIAGVIIPIFLHMIASESMPWWPDTVSMGIAFGAAALAIVWKNRKDGETRRRLWSALRAVGRRWTSN
jgi:hypothetical protein